jgi:hypothetical protein
MHALGGFIRFRYFFHLLTVQKWLETINNLEVPRAALVEKKKSRGIILKKGTNVRYKVATVKRVRRHLKVLFLPVPNHFRK